MKKQDNAIMGSNGLIGDLNLIKHSIGTLKLDLEDIVREDKNYDGELDIWIQAIKNFEEKTATVKNVNQLNLKNQASVLSYIIAIMSFAEELYEGCDDCAEDSEDDLDFFTPNLELEEPIVKNKKAKKK